MLPLELPAPYRRYRRCEREQSILTGITSNTSLPTVLEEKSTNT
jgi:hypothetical protein